MDKPIPVARRTDRIIPQTQLKRFFRIVLVCTVVVGLGSACERKKPHQVELTWQPSSGQDITYSVYRSDAENKPFVPVAMKIQGTKYTDTNVEGGKTYRYRVVAVDKEGRESAPTPVKTVKVPQ